MAYQVTAHGYDGQLIALVREIPTKPQADAEAERLFARRDVCRVARTEQHVDLAFNGNGRYR